MYGGVTEADLRAAMTFTGDVRPGRSAATRHVQYLAAKEKRKKELDSQLVADLTASRKRKRGRRPPKPAGSVSEQSLLRLARVLRKQASQRLRDARKKPAQFTLTTMYGEEVAALQEKRESTQCDTCKKWRIVDEQGNWANEVFVCSQVGIACDEPCAECNEQCEGNC